MAEEDDDDEPSAEEEGDLWADEEEDEDNEPPEMRTERASLGLRRRRMSPGPIRRMTSLRETNEQ